MKRLGNIEVDWWCTDAWKVFAQALSYDKHLIGKKFTKVITALRNSCKRLHRRTTAFSRFSMKVLKTNDSSIIDFKLCNKRRTSYNKGS